MTGRRFHREHPPPPRPQRTPPTGVVISVPHPNHPPLPAIVSRPLIVSTPSTTVVVPLPVVKPVAVTQPIVFRAEQRIGVRPPAQPIIGVRPPATRQQSSHLLRGRPSPARGAMAAQNGAGGLGGHRM
eukprot:sb/3475396/